MVTADLSIVDARRRWLLVCAASLVGWAMLVLIVGTQGYVAAAYRDRATSWWQSLLYPGAYYAIWALLTPLVYWLVTRVTLREGARRFAAVHVTAGLAVALVHAGAFVIALPRVMPGVWPDASARSLLMNVLVANVHTNVLIYALVAGLALGIELYARYRERELRTSMLEARLAEAELATLRAQLQPHFLFNTLHAIQTLVHDDPEAADRTIARLADLLRMTLDSHGAQEVSLRHELAFLDRYLQIEQTRLGTRLRVTMTVDDETLDARVPVLSIQPLVENAIKHGVSTRADGGAVDIHVRRSAESLIVSVEDDGPGLAIDPRADGVGLANTRARLEQLYGADQELRVESRPSSGAAVTFRIPFAAHEASAHARVTQSVARSPA